jgi:hypothetical protein
MHHLPRLALAFSLLAAVPLGAQQNNVRHESLTNWTHALTAPNWTDDLPLAEADFGKVDQLNFAPVLSYLSGNVTLQPGAYSAACRVRKITDQTGAYDLRFFTIVEGHRVESTLAVAAQTTDQWVLTPSLVFVVTQPNTQLAFRIEALAGTTPIQNYQFDSFALGKVDVGPATVSLSLARDFWGAWGLPYYNRGVLNADSAYGVVDQLNYVWWVEFGTRQPVRLPAGTYVANARLKKTLNASNTQDLFVKAQYNNQTFQVTLLIANQPVDTWVLTPDLTFTLGQTTDVTFKVENTTGSYKTNYLFDAFFVRTVGAVTAYGTACNTSRGTPALSGTGPKLIGQNTLTCTAVPGAGAMILGGQELNLDLGAIGMPGCLLLSDLLLSLPITGSSGVATLNYTLPNNPALLAGTFKAQAVLRDPPINTLGFATSNGASCFIGN